MLRSDGQSLGGGGGVLVEQQRDRVGAERSALACREQRLVGVAVALACSQLAQDRDGLAGQRGDPFLAAFAVTADVRAGAEADVADA